MTLKEYVEILNKYLEENPKYADMPVMYFTDDEGNAAHILDIDEPQLFYCEDPDSHYLELFDEDDDEADEGFGVICIN